MTSIVSKSSQHAATASHNLKGKSKDRDQKQQRALKSKNQKAYNIEDFKKKEVSNLIQKNFSSSVAGYASSNKANIDKNSINNNYISKIKRPQTPDAYTLKNGKYEISKLPEPQFIIKEIQRNVNFLKQMYYVSLSQHNSSIQKNSKYPQFLGGSQQRDLSQDITLQSVGNSKNIRKPFDTYGLNKKSTPEVNAISHFQPHDIQKAIETLSKKGNGYKKSKSKNNSDCALKSKSQQRKAKEKQSRQMSNSNLHKAQNKAFSKKQHHSNKQKTNKLLGEKIQSFQQNCQSPSLYDTKKQKTPGNQNNCNLNNLFEMFKYYKRSTDPNLSKRQSKTHLLKNGQSSANNSQNYKSASTCISTKNQNSLYDKETPNNSTAKNTTNKNSTISRNNGSSIEASFEQKSRQNSKGEGRSRKNSASNQNKKRCPRKGQSKKKNQKKQKEPKQNNMNIENAKQRQKNGNSYSENQCNKKIDQKQKRVQKHPFQQEKHNFKKKSFPVSGNRKSQNICDSHQIQQLGQQLGHQHAQQNFQHLEFPEIQSSMFDRNMPILEQDSRQQASSDFIALTNQKQKHSFDPNIEKGFGTENMQDLGSKIQKMQQAGQQTMQQSKVRPVIRGLQKAGIKNSKIQIHNYFAFDPVLIQKIYNDKKKQNQKNAPKIQITQRNSKEMTEDSLAGCEIPRRQSDDSDLDNFELVSIEL